MLTSVYMYLCVYEYVDIFVYMYMCVYICVFI